jgi:hypothetical protein
MVTLRIPPIGTPIPESVNIALLQWVAEGITNEQAARVLKRICGCNYTDVEALKSALTIEGIDWVLA